MRTKKRFTLHYLIIYYTIQSSHCMFSVNSSTSLLMPLDPGNWFIKFLIWRVTVRRTRKCIYYENRTLTSNGVRDRIFETIVNECNPPGNASCPRAPPRSRRNPYISRYLNTELLPSLLEGKWRRMCVCVCVFFCSVCMCVRVCVWRAVGKHTKWHVPKRSFFFYLPRSCFCLNDPAPIQCIS